MSNPYQPYQNSQSKHEIQITLPQNKQNANSITISKPSQKSIVISRPNPDKGATIITKKRDSQQNDQQIKVTTTQPQKTQQNQNQLEFTKEELEMQEIAKQNQQIILSNQFQISPSQTIFENEHYQVSIKIHQSKPTYSNTPIIINKMSTIGSTIEIHKNKTFSICVLNFADFKVKCIISIK